MKSPPQQFTDHEARARTEAFIRNERHTARAQHGDGMEAAAS
jgi:hypothetical protein